MSAFPTWFVDGKLGIWSHWGPQSVPMMGDWYARQLYMEGSKHYADHLERYGHPSQHGFKDIIPLWKAEQWDPDGLMSLYKRAGATYFVSMAVHHDNFDLWDSTHNRWNAVNMGPMKDVVGIWQNAAQKEGLRFGVSEHLGASFTWYQVAKGADKEGPFTDVPYDGNDPAFEDLYHPRTETGDTEWYTKDPRFFAVWERRIRDLIDKYQPDLLYSDGGLPFGEVGLRVVEHLYEQSRARHGGEQQAVYNCKEPGDGRWVYDVERGVLPGIEEHPWQIDTSIGDWYYNKHWTYRGAEWVIRMLVDVVSKNGNLLLNVVQRPDGALDPEAEQVLNDMADWMAINGESIYGTRPWKVFGEGPHQAEGGAFKEEFGFTAKDVRYTAKGGILYATLLGKPEPGEIVLSSLAGHEVEQVTLLENGRPLEWTQGSGGLCVTLPGAEYSPLANVIKIQP